MLGGDFSYTLDGVIMIICFNRPFFIINYWAVSNRWTHGKYKSMMEKQGVEPTFSVWLKLEKKHHLLSVNYCLNIFSITIYVFIYCGFILSYLETSFESNFKPSWETSSKENNFWLTFVTITTVGYGDGYPSTHLSRFIMMICCIFGRFL